MVTTENPNYAVRDKGFMPMWKAEEEQKQINANESTGDSLGFGWYDREGHRWEGTLLS